MSSKTVYLLVSGYEYDIGPAFETREMAEEVAEATQGGWSVYEVIAEDKAPEPRRGWYAAYDHAQTRWREPMEETVWPWDGAGDFTDPPTVTVSPFGWVSARGTSAEAVRDAVQRERERLHWD